MISDIRTNIISHQGNETNILITALLIVKYQLSMKCPIQIFSGILV